MKRTKLLTTDERETHFKHLCQELGEDTIKKLHKAFTLTAAALYRRAKQQAEAQLRKEQEQHRGSQ